MRLAEGYLSTPSVLGEADDEEEQQGQGGQGQAPMGPDADSQQPPMEGAPDGGMGPGPEQGQGQTPMGPDADGQQPPMEGASDSGMVLGPEQGGETPMGPIGMEDGLEPQDDDVVLDVEDLTQAQEKLNHKQNNIGHDLGKVDDRIEALMTAVEKMQGIIANNNNEIIGLKKELEKRVPTQTERLNLRSLDVYPYNVKPTDYFQKVNQNGNYQVTYDNGQPTKKEHVLTQKEIDSYNPSEIEKSFDNDDLDQSMEKIFKDFR